MSVIPDIPAMVADPLPEVVLTGVRIHAIDQKRCVARVMGSLDAGRGGWIATANLDHLRRLRSDAEFRRVYDDAALVVADGMPLVWAARLQGTPLPERVAGSDLIHSLSAAAAERGRRIFLVGGDPGTAEAAAAKLAADNPGLQVAGTDCPPFGFERDPDQMADLRRKLAASGADLVFVGLGSPKQEFLIEAIHEVLPAAWWVGIGISFSFVCGEVRRAPVWVRRVGLEWAHRLLQEPRRLGARYLWHGPPFVVRLFASALFGRFRPSSGRTPRNR